MFFSNINQNIQLEKNNDLIIEIASNDGKFLKPYVDDGFKKVIGVDPAKNICDVAN